MEKTRKGKRSRYVIQGERKKIQFESPKGEKVASIDLGVKITHVVR